VVQNFGDAISLRPKESFQIKNKPFIARQALKTNVVRSPFLEEKAAGYSNTKKGSRDI